MNAGRFMGAALLICALGAGPGGQAAGAAAPGKDLVEQGQYLVRIAGCNDCHTPGYLLSEGKIPEKLWLTGDSFGWRGPWGTTYATNLRIMLQSLTEDQWVAYARAFKTRPPMPWFTVNQMKERDLRAIYQYVRHLGPGGTAAPAFVPPGKEPKPPYASFPPPPPSKK